MMFCKEILLSKVKVAPERLTESNPCIMGVIFKVLRTDLRASLTYVSMTCKCG